MATVVVGGPGKHIGKTALVCGIVAALPEYRWVAVKFTTHDHSLANAEVAGPFEKKRGDREAKPASPRKDNIREEMTVGQGTDTARYLAAGAARAFLVTAQANDFPAALAAVRAILDPGPDASLAPSLGATANLIFESNRILGSLEPDICLAIHSGTTQPKPSFRLTTRRADAWVLQEGGAWKLPADEPAVPVFRLKELARIPIPMQAWLRARLGPVRCS